MSQPLADRVEIRMAGEGGQGMILAGIILAEAAAIYDGKNAVQTQSYGPEARGGASKSEVVISSGEIDHPEVLAADVVVTLSQEAFKKFAGTVKPGGLLIVDAERVNSASAPTAIRLPIERIAFDATGRDITANTVALGVLVALTGVVSREVHREGGHRPRPARHRRDEPQGAPGRLPRRRASPRIASISWR